MLLTSIHAKPVISVQQEREHMKALLSTTSFKQDKALPWWNNVSFLPVIPYVEMINIIKWGKQGKIPIAILLPIM